jgi:hypothetical protein
VVYTGAPEPEAAAAALTGVLVLATAVWIGGFVTLVVVSRVAARTLDAAERIGFFRGLGRAYGAVAGLALALALTCGALLVAGRAWDGVLAAAVAIAAALVAGTVLGVAQARRMTRLRHRALQDRQDVALATRVRRAARRAGALRTTLGLLSLALLALGVLLAT